MPVFKTYQKRLMMYQDNAGGYWLVIYDDEMRAEYYGDGLHYAEREEVSAMLRAFIAGREEDFKSGNMLTHRDQQEWERPLWYAGINPLGIHEQVKDILANHGDNNDLVLSIERLEKNGLNDSQWHYWINGTPEMIEWAMGF